jgi:amino acid transporter
MKPSCEPSAVSDKLPKELKSRPVWRVRGFRLATLVEIGGMLAAFIVCMACATAGARTLFAMGRERVPSSRATHSAGPAGSR